MYQPKHRYSEDELHQHKLSDLQTELRCAIEQGDREDFPEYVLEIKAKIAALQAD